MKNTKSVAALAKKKSEHALCATCRPSTGLVGFG